MGRGRAVRAGPRHLPADEGERSPRDQGDGATGDGRRRAARSSRSGVNCQAEMMIAAFSISPAGIGESVSAAVADAVRLVRASGLPNETNAMCTNVEGEWDEVMDLIKACV